MTVLFYVVIALHIIACLFLIAVVLLQQGKGGDLAAAFGGGGSQTAFGPRGSANVLSRTTTVLAGVFMVTCLALNVLKPKAKTLLDDVAAPAPAAATTPVKPATPPAAPSPAGK